LTTTQNIALDSILPALVIVWPIAFITNNRAATAKQAWEINALCGNQSTPNMANPTAMNTPDPTTPKTSHLNKASQPNIPCHTLGVGCWGRGVLEDVSTCSVEVSLPDRELALDRLLSWDTCGDSAAIISGPLSKRAAGFFAFFFFRREFPTS